MKGLPEVFSIGTNVWWKSVINDFLFQFTKSIMFGGLLEEEI